MGIIATRTVTVKTLLWMICAAAAASTLAPPAIGQTAEQRVAACIANNGVRYGEPSSATVAQYFSLVAACQAAAQSGSGVEVLVTPEPTRQSPPNAPKTSAGTPNAPAAEESTSPRRPSEDGSASPESPTPKTGDRATVSPAGGRTGRANNTDTAGLVKKALAVREPTGRSLLSPASALTPAGAGGLAAAALVGVGGYLLRRRRLD